MNNNENSTASSMIRIQSRQIFVVVVDRLLQVRSNPQVDPKASHYAVLPL